MVDILPLITVWLQVRVLPGPPSGYFFSVLIIHDYFSYLFQAILQL